MNWYWIAIVSATFFGINVLLIRALADQAVPRPLIMLALYFFGGLVALYLYYKSPEKAHLTFKISAGLIFVGLLSAAGMLTQIKSIAFAPNPGYTAAIISAQALVAALLAVFIFGSPLSWIKGLGILFTLIGVALIAIDG